MSEKRRQRILTITVDSYIDKIRGHIPTLQQHIDFGWRIDLATPITRDGFTVAIEYILSIEKFEDEKD